MNSTRIGTLHWAIMMFFLLTCYLAIIAGLFGVVGAKIVSFVALLGAFANGAILAVYLLSELLDVSIKGMA